MTKRNKDQKQPQEGEILTGDVVHEAPSADELEQVAQKLTQSQLKAQEYLDGWQRTMADFSNYKKRVERDQVLTYQNAAGTVAKRFLVLLDDLERALNVRPQDNEGAAWAGGIELIYRKLISALEAEGVKQMDAVGKQFDPNMHEAIMQAPSEDHASGEVIEVLQNGYLIGDRVLRPAVVRIAS